MAFHKPCIMGAGPFALHPEVAIAMMTPIDHHMMPHFYGIYKETLRRLQGVFKTRNFMILSPCSGTGMLEAAVVNCFSPGDKIILGNGGLYGVRFGDMLKNHGLVPVEIPLPQGEPLMPDMVVKTMRGHPDAKGVMVIHVETSTGTLSPLEDIAKAVKGENPEILLLVDAVASMGGVPIETDAWKLDVVVTASQKALFAAPGLGIASVSDLAWERIAQSTLPNYYFSYMWNREEFSHDRYPMTPAVTVIHGLHKALEIIEREGLAELQAGCRSYSDYLISNLPELGFRPLPRRGYAAPTVTAAFVPEGVSALQLMRRLHDELNITICTGFGENLDKVIRLGHMGYVDMADVQRAFHGIRQILDK